VRVGPGRLTFALPNPRTFGGEDPPRVVVASVRVTFSIVSSNDIGHVVLRQSCLISRRVSEGSQRRRRAFRASGGSRRTGLRLWDGLLPRRAPGNQGVRRAASPLGAPADRAEPASDPGDGPAAAGRACRLGVLEGAGAVAETIEDSLGQHL